MQAPQQTSHTTRLVTAPATPRNFLQPKTSCRPATQKGETKLFQASLGGFIGLRRSVLARYKSSKNRRTSEEEPLSDDYDLTGAISGEWSATWSLASYEDVLEHFNRSVLEESISPDTPLAKVMQTKVKTCNPETPLADVAEILESERISGMPVVAPDIGIVVGVVSKKDITQTLGAVVEDVMSSPPVATRKETTVQEAACIMLKYKVHRLPVVDDRARCIGIVTRSDIFAALGLSAVDLGAGNATVNAPIKKSTRLV